MRSSFKSLFMTCSGDLLQGHQVPSLNQLNYSGIIIYVNEENITKYEKNILKYFKTDIIGFDTEYVIDVSKKLSNNFQRGKHFLLNNNLRNSKGILGGTKVLLSSDNILNKRTKERTSNSFFENYREKSLNDRRSSISSVLSDILGQKTNVKGGRSGKRCSGDGGNGRGSIKNDSKIAAAPSAGAEGKRLCLIQLSSKDVCFVFNINKLNGRIPTSVKDILENNKIIKVCHDIKNDKDMFLSCNIEIKNVFDLYNYSIENFIYPPSLQSLVKIYLKKYLNKYFRLSNWLSGHLKEEQILYAAIDAYASREIYLILKGKNKIAKSNFFNLSLVNDVPSEKRDETFVQEQGREQEKYSALEKCKGKGINPCSKQNQLYYAHQKCQNTTSVAGMPSVPNAGLSKDCINTHAERKRQNKISNPNESNNKLNNNTYEKGEKKEAHKRYEYVERNKLYIINNLKNQINAKCSQMGNISFLEEMCFSNSTYKKRLLIKHMEKDDCLIKLYSFSYEDEIACCREILRSIESGILYW
ncbi:3'-5' exonuclease [Plasmodium brasilianum]|uniref:3'-5' exonuclease n=2 Tax=Plasmodium (Plasmodium) TaxID=418103 RepID=A0A1A8VM24_PLAMA|nr:DNA binding protein, putative [Plasmodium malariae]KAI4840935.1 3'-5' exonuclease [Plasmodium brasilianum]SBS81661.1 DNA binding protein, putative [Plasmodium malariae]SBT87133.1 DNA binding protein, putative [Plasmodium malariae]